MKGCTKLAKMKTNYWVTGNITKGFKIVTKQPKAKFVREPQQSIIDAQRYIAGIYSGYNY
jgi:hypothetical protein